MALAVCRLIRHHLGALNFHQVDQGLNHHVGGAAVVHDARSLPSNPLH